jgi:hypothetical protein
MEHLNINIIAHHIGMLELQLMDAKAQIEQLKQEPAEQAVDLGNITSE